MKKLKTIRNISAQVPWMWIIITAIVGILLLFLTFILAGKASNLSNSVLQMYGGGG